MNNQKKNKDEKKNKKKKILIILLIILLILLFAFCVFKFCYNYGQTNKPIGVDDAPKRQVFEISDNKISKWEETNDINVFSLGNERTYVAPYDSGTYEFEIKNVKNGEIFYRLTLEENNPYDVNIKYKLRRNNIYVVGGDNWVTYDQVATDVIQLPGKKADQFVLEWSWVSEDNTRDTKIGYLKDRADYKVSLKIEVEDGK